MPRSINPNDTYVACLGAIDHFFRHRPSICCQIHKVTQQGKFTRV